METRALGFVTNRAAGPLGVRFYRRSLAQNTSKMKVTYHQLDSTPYLDKGNMPFYMHQQEAEEGRVVYLAVGDDAAF